MLLSPLSVSQLNRTAIKRICKTCEQQRLHKRVHKVKEYAWKGRRHDEEELFPCNEMHIHCNHRGKSQNPNHALTALKPKPENFNSEMNGQMSAMGSAGPTRYPDEEGVEAWSGRAYWIGEDLKGSFHTE
jgi:hypothetical protein